MKSIALYQSKDTVIHHWLDPMTKLIYLLCSMFAAFFVPTFMGALVILLINLVLLSVGKELSRAIKAILGSGVLLITVFVIQGLFNPANHTLVFTIGPIHVYREGLMFALTLAFRVVNIIAASSLLVLTTSPSAVMDACMRRGLSPRIGYVMTAILQMIPVMMDSVTTIREAQQSRGMRVDGNVWHRMKVFIPLMGPVVLSSFVSIQERAMALEVRGFSTKGKHSFYHEEVVAREMPLLRVVIVLAAIGIVIWGIFQ